MSPAKRRKMAPFSADKGITPLIAELPSDEDQGEEGDVTAGKSAVPAAAAASESSSANGVPTTFPGNMPCPEWCCRMGEGLSRRHFLMEHYPRAQTTTGLNDMTFSPLLGSIQALADMIRECAAPWDKLPSAARDKMNMWSPVARELWESDFHRHREALIRAWIWHYLDDNLLACKGDAASGDLAPCASPAWTHARALLRELDVLRVGRPGVGEFDPPRHRVQYHAWRQLTDSLIREGLGQEVFATPGDLVPHFKQSLRLLVADGRVQIPDDLLDGQWYHAIGCLSNDAQSRTATIKDVLKAALRLQHYQGSMGADCQLRFTPIGSDKLWGFPVDKESMHEFAPIELPPTRPGEPLPPVQLVCDPMLALTFTKKWVYNNDPEVWEGCKMQVVAPWTFGGEAAEKYMAPGFKKGWYDRDLQEAREAWAAEQAERQAAMEREGDDDQYTDCPSDERHGSGEKGVDGEKGGKRGKGGGRGKRGRKE